jgi:hypothetical protein
MLKAGVPWCSAGRLKIGVERAPRVAGGSVQVAAASPFGSTRSKMPNRDKRGMGQMTYARSSDGWDSREWRGMCGAPFTPSHPLPRGAIRCLAVTGDANRLTDPSAE